MFNNNPLWLYLLAISAFSCPLLSLADTPLNNPLLEQLSEALLKQSLPSEASTETPETPKAPEIIYGTDADTNASQHTQLPPTLIKNIQMLPDPTQPPNGQITLTQDTSLLEEPIATDLLQLYQILQGKHGLTAIINGERYKTGDSIGDKKITDITLYTVSIKDGTNTFELSLFNQIKKAENQAQKTTEASQLNTEETLENNSTQ